VIFLAIDTVSSTLGDISPPFTMPWLASSPQAIMQLITINENFFISLFFMLFILQVFIFSLQIYDFFCKKSQVPKKNFKVNPSLTVSTVQRVKRLIKVQSSQ